VTAPAILGSGGGGGKGGGGSSRTPVESPDSLLSKQYATVLDAISEGEIGGLVAGFQSVFLDDVPVQNPDGSYNFQNVYFDMRTGTQSQPYIAGVSSVESETAVGAEVKYGSPVTRTITNANADSARVTLSIPNLTSLNTSNGDLSGTSVGILIQVQTAGGGFVDAIYDTITGKTTTKYQRAYKVSLPGSGPWDIRVSRLTADSTTSSLTNKTWWDSYTEIIDAKLSYPNTALITIGVDAEQFRTIPRRGYEIYGIICRVPVNYDVASRTYAGVWDGTFKLAWTDNPAWCFYDLLTNERYGLGGYLDASQVDKWELYKIGKYCDEYVPDGFGGYEPRFTCNLYMQGQEDAYKVITTFASMFRGLVYWAGGAITAGQDAPADPIALFTPANVIDGTFTYTGSSIKARHTVALVTWNDPKDRYKQRIEYVEDHEGIAKYGIATTEVVAVGCTSRGQAHRFGRAILYSERRQTEVVSFKVGLDGFGIYPGCVIQISDPIRAGIRLGGRCVSATSTVFTLDSEVTLVPGKTYVLWVTNPDGTVKSYPVIQGPGTSNVITFPTAISPVPIPDSMWVLAVSDLAPEKWRVIAIQENDDLTATISALAHSDGKYTEIDTGLKLEEAPTSAIPLTPSQPTGLIVTETLYLAGPGTISTRAFVSWIATGGNYQLSYRRESDNWVTLPITSQASETIDGWAPGSYTFKLVQINALGLRSPVLAQTVALLGKVAPPADVTGFAASVYGAGIHLGWSHIADLDLLDYLIRQGADWGTGVDVGYFASNNATVPALASGTVKFWIKARDTSKVFSTNATLITIVVEIPDPPVVTQQAIDNNVLLYWTEPASTQLIDTYELREGSTWAGARVIGTKSGLFTTVFETLAGDYTYWVAAIDVAGNYGVPASVTATVSQPPDYVLRTNIDSTLNGTLSNALKADGALVLPVDTTETFAQHFTTHSWSAPADQVTAGYPLYIQPALTSGYYEESVDYGSVISTSKITVALDMSVISGSPTSQVTISTKLNSGDAWTDFVGVTSLFATNFRYFKIKVVVTSGGGTGLCRITGINIRLDVKRRSDGGTVSCLSTDTSGTQVNFNVPFIAVDSVVVSPGGTASMQAVYDFAGAPNPVGFKVYLFNASGTRISGPVGWSAKGY